MQPATFAENDLAPLQDLLTDDSVNEVVINPDGQIFVERATSDHMQRVDLELPESKVKSLGANLAGETNNVLGDKHPIVSGRVMVFGAPVRVQVVVPPAIETGVSVSIRKYVSRLIPIDEIRYIHGAKVDVGTERSNAQQKLADLAIAGDLPALFQSAIDLRLNILISGGTSSGKTTMARALLALSNQEERLVTIEDALELHPPHPNQVSLVAERQTGSERSPARLLESALRMRPDRLILGEIRGEEALNFLEAINTGHPGSISTIHADTPDLALERMALMVMRTGLRLARQDVIDYAKATIDMIVQVGRHEGRRGVLQIVLPSLKGDTAAEAV